MPSALPGGDPVPADGSLPAEALADVATTPFGVYLHVPFCRVRCGYCDFNTYTPSELHGSGAGSDMPGYLDAVRHEVQLASRVLSDNPPSAVDTVFVGGGTPTLLAAEQLTSLVDAAVAPWGLRPGAEVTTEANPDTLTPQYAQALAAAGFTRVSIGMQSAVPHVLATLDRTHDPANVRSAVTAVRAAGLQVSLDLIYGTPGETLADWRTSLEAAIELRPDHVSAYALIVEDGTKLAGQIRRGLVAAPDPDDQADKYETTDQMLTAAGLGWYEISNWATDAAARCRHNEGYWASHHWWGFGPGAHSHVGGVRWWNVKHPAAYAGRLGSGVSPGAGREQLTPEQQQDERVLLQSRMVDGIAVADLDVPPTVIADLIAQKLIEGRAAITGRVVLTRRGRLLADTVVHRLTT